jgi:hypothetical protein
MFGYLMLRVLFLGFDGGRSYERIQTIKSTYAHTQNNKQQ